MGQQLFDLARPLRRQAALRRADLLAALGELVPLENGDLVSELIDDRFIAMDLSALGVDLGHQLRSERAQLFGGAFGRDRARK